MSGSAQKLYSAYSSQGFVHGIDILSRSEVSRHCSLMQKYEEQHGPMHYRVKPYLVFGSAYEIATHPRILDAMEQDLGPGILLWDSACITNAINYVRPNARQTVEAGKSATLVRGVDPFQHFRPEPQCGDDNVAANVEFQAEAERLR